MFSRRTLFVSAAALVGASAAPRGARADASAWSEATHSAVRLVAGGSKGGLLAGIEIRLATDFKTYWRDPGDSGVPPVFDWSGSDNLAGVEVLWPAPHRFEDGAGSSIGYKAPVLLPVRVTPADAAQPVRLQLKIDYAVCAKMCIPAHGVAALTMTGGKGDGPHAARIAAALAKVPAKAAMTDAPAAGAAVSGVALLDGAKPALAVDAWAPRDAALELFVEGPEGSFFARPTIEHPKEPPRGGLARVRFVSTIDERAKNLARWPLTLTLVVDGEGREYSAEIDAPPKR